MWTHLKPSCSHLLSFRQPRCDTDGRASPHRTYGSPQTHPSSQSDSVTSTERFSLRLGQRARSRWFLHQCTPEANVSNGRRLNLRVPSLRTNSEPLSKNWPRPHLSPAIGPRRALGTMRASPLLACSSAAASQKPTLRSSWMLPCAKQAMRSGCSVVTTSLVRPELWIKAAQ